MIGPEDVHQVLPAGGKPGSPVTRGDSGPGGARPAGFDATVSLTDALDRYERDLISDALTRAEGNVAEAARALQTDRANLYRRMKRLGLAARGEAVGGER